MNAPDPVDQARAWLAGQTPGRSAGPATAAGPAAHEHLSAATDHTARSKAAPPAHVRVATDRVATEASAGEVAADDVMVGDVAGTGVGDSASRASPAEAPVDPGDPDADPESVARSIALRLLTAQARTRQELDRALRRKNVPTEVAASVLDRLEQVGLINDETFARDWVESRQQRRHLSRAALRRELQTKGIDRIHVEAALATVDAGDEMAAAHDLARKKMAATAGLDPLVRRRRTAGALARRGFGSEITARVLAELGAELDDIPGA